MKTNRRSFIWKTLAGGFAAATCFTPFVTANGQSLAPAEARQIAEDAYIYGYSLVTTEVTRVQMSNVPKVEGLTAPMGQFINVGPLSACQLPRRFCAECGCAVFDCLA